MSDVSCTPIERQASPPGERSGLAIVLAGIAALLASSCCVLPLLFVLVGVSGAWISQLRRLEPYSTGLIVLAVASLAFAAWRLYRDARTIEASCGADVDECRRSNVAARRWLWLVAALTLIPIVVPLVAPLFY